MLSAQDTQFSLNDEGQILYQEKPGNPVPGAPVAQLKKGEHALSPQLALLDGKTLSQAEQEKLCAWLGNHIKTVLEPLVNLKTGDELPAPVKAIADKMYEALGILPREEVEAEIAQLDTDLRATLRTKRVRLGPILVFQPDLNKPAAVRLRALLWSLYNDKPLPAPTPKDGVVSFEIDPATADKAFYQAVGYPVYGPRAIRIDMLDRVISAIYDSADKGKFKAEHKMAEWLGSSIENLYAVLEAMGHTKIYDPADEAKAAEEKTEEAKAEETSADTSAETPAEAPQPAEAPKEQPKPELATFRLKKGKANKDAPPKAKQQNKDKPKKQKGKRNKSTNKTPKVMSAEAKTEADSPFAVLEQLKKNG